MVTLRDVAQAAGVSSAAASYALTGSKKITADTAQRVRLAAEKLHYTGNFAAKSLRTGKSDIIAVAVFELNREYPAELSAAIANHALKRNVQALIQQISYSTQDERMFLENMANQYSDGLLLSSAELPGVEIESLSKGRPVVILDDATITTYDTVLTPRVEGTTAVLDYLYKIGRRQTLIIGAKYRTKKQCLANRSVENRFLEGCYRSCANHGARLNRSNIISLDEWDVEQARLKAHELVAQHRAFDSAICATDTVAIGFMRGLSECGVNVPGQVSVVGFDGIKTGRYLTPSLTTVAVDIEEIARHSVDLLLQRVSEPERKRFSPQHVTVGYTLRIGESTSYLEH